MKAIRLRDIPDKGTRRIKTNIAKFDEFLGGGFVPGSSVLFAGEPGVGKSTILLQISQHLAKAGNKVLYASGEENLSQIKSRANRLGTLHPKIWCSENLNLEELFVVTRNLEPSVIIVDSIQLLYSNTLSRQIGSPAQIRNCLLALIDYVKKTNKVLITIGHANKAGKVAGLLTLQHMVDVVCYMRKKEGDLRQLESQKNRFGRSSIFWDIEMTGTGISDVSNLRSLTIDYDKIQAILKSNPVNSYIVKSDIKWLLGKFLGTSNEPEIKKFEITYILEKDKKE